MKPPVVLILSHCGFAFVEQLAPLVREASCEVRILSSLPEKAVDSRRACLEELCDQLYMTDDHTLTWQDVQAALDDAAGSDREVVCCISVWEGYRQLMARANQLLGTKDTSPEQVATLTDKYLLRKVLLDREVSEVGSELLNEDAFRRHQLAGGRKFIKPRRGAASFGTFRLSESTTWDSILALKAELEGDVIFNGIFEREDTFVIEDYIDGQEYSVEIIMKDGLHYILAIHEKGCTEKNMTSLETTCITPPQSLNNADYASLASWLNDVFAAFGVEDGCFHLEAKLTTGGKWEIIEINPRVGGSLISKSVEQFTGGYCILRLWLGALVADKVEHALHPKDILGKLSVSGSKPSPSGKATFFRVYYCDKGVIESIKENPVPVPACFAQQIAKAGDRYDSDNKENFLGQALWTFGCEQMSDVFNEIYESSKDLYTVSYC
jgi:predicted ATP-grasp superfamily ATP-dependent carboligase